MWKWRKDYQEQNQVSPFILWQLKNSVRFLMISPSSSKLAKYHLSTETEQVLIHVELHNYSNCYTTQHIY